MPVVEEAELEVEVVELIVNSADCARIVLSSVVLRTKFTL